MEIFVGIPTPELAEPIGQLQEVGWFKNYLRPSRLEPHITLITPSPIDDPESFMKRLSEVKEPSMQIKVTSPIFINPTTLALEVKSSYITQLQKSISAALGQNAERLFRPHITVGRTAKSISPTMRKEILKSAADTLGPDLTFTIDKIRVYGQIGSQSYETLADIPLTAD